MSLVTIRQKIGEKLATLTGDGQPLQEWHANHVAALGGYPAATFEPSDVVNDFETNVENRRTYAYRITLHQEMEKVGRDSAIGILCGAVDSLIDAFDEDPSLGGSVIECKALPSVWGIYREGTGLVLYAELKLEAWTITNVT